VTTPAAVARLTGKDECHDVPAVAAGDAVPLDVLRAYPGTSRPLQEYHQELLRGPSPLSVAERELIAARPAGK